MLRQKRWQLFAILLLTIANFLLLSNAQRQRKLEIQLAGIRLGSPVIDKDENGNLKPTCLLRVWGFPDLIIVPSPMPTQPSVTPGAPMMPGMPGAPMMPGGLTGPGAPLGMGSGFGGQPPIMGRGGMPTAPMMGTPYGEMPPSGYETSGAMTPMPGMAGTTVPTVPTPEFAWAIPVFIRPQQNQRLWLYKREQAALSFLEQDGIVVAIAVAGEKFPYAKTALGDPFKSIELGDDLQRVLLRYGPPDEATPVGLMSPIQTTAVGIYNMVSLRYHKRSNVEFLVVNNKIRRIFIFLPERIEISRAR